jgi:predicted transposase/invertase (TIGR01784 family)
MSRLNLTLKRRSCYEFWRRILMTAILKWPMQKEGLTEGEVKGKRETAVNALGMGLSVEQISKLTGLTKEEVAELKVKQWRDKKRY